MEADFTQSLNRASELRILLNKASHAYYVLDSPLMEDSVYDSLYRELLEIESQNPNLITEDSPSQRLGGKPSKGFNSIKHRLPLLSLDNAFNLKELADWHTKIQLFCNFYKYHLVVLRNHISLFFHSTFFLKLELIFYYHIVILNFLPFLIQNANKNWRMV